MRRKKAAALLILLPLLLVIFTQRAQAVPTTRIRVAFNCNQAPFHFVDSEGNAAGLHIDMLEHIAGRVGYELEYVPVETSTECQEAMERGEVDLILNISRRLENSEWITETLSEETICVVAGSESDPDTQSGKKGTAAVQLGTITPTVSVHLRADQTIAVSSQKKAVDLLVAGDADTAVVLKESALYYLDSLDTQRNYVISNNYVGSVAFSLQVAENDYRLLQTLDREIANLRVSNAYSQIREKWNQTDPEEADLVWLERMVLILLITVLAVGLYAVIVSNVRRALRRQVEKQTRDLQVANREIRSHLEQLEAESDMRNRIIRYSHLAMVLFDKNGRILLVNNSAAALTERWGEKVAEQQDVRQTPIFGEIVNGCDMDELFGQEATSAEGVHTVEVKQGARKSRYRYSLQRIFKAEKVWAVLLAAEDITDEEARRNEKFEEEKNRTLNQVVAGIAHEIKNPLTSIKTFVTVLESAHADPQFMKDFACYVPAEVERINRLVESLISYAKPARSVRETVCLSEVVQEVAFFAESSNQNKRIRIVSDIEPGHEIMGNRDQIKQILINTVINGRETMEEKLATLPGDAQLELRISLKKSEKGSLVAIRDEGMGMSAEAIEQCMNPFFTTKRTGTGLGLTLSKQFAQDNNGELTISSEVGSHTEIQIEFGRIDHEAENTDR